MDPSPKPIGEAADLRAATAIPVAERLHRSVAATKLKQQIERRNLKCAAQYSLIDQGQFRWIATIRIPLAKVYSAFAVHV